METAVVASGTYPDSVDSSPRSRGDESWEEPSFPAATTVPSKLRFMCSYDGQILPRPHDKTLCYLGGETRMVSISRHESLSDLRSRISRSLLTGRPFSLKYQLPSEDLDSLISVSTDEDLDNMIEEYDRVNGGAGNKAPSRLRLFLFPKKPESASSASSMGSILDDSKSETWFVDALNGSIGMGGVLPRDISEDSFGSSINCLLGLDDERNNFSATSGPKTKMVLDFPILDTSSSFGSVASSGPLPSPSPSSSNVTPIRVRMEESFSQMNVSVSEKKQEEEGKELVDLVDFRYTHHSPQPTNVDPPPAAVSTASTTSPTENTNFGDGDFAPDDEKHGGIGMLPQTAVQHQPASDRISPGAFDLNPPSDLKQEAQFMVADSSYVVQVPEQGYTMPMQSEQFQQQQQMQQFIHANPHLVHQHPSNPVVPIQSYYQVHHPIHTQQQLAQSHSYNHNIPMYYMPLTPNPSYTIPVQQQTSNLPETAQFSASNMPTTIPILNSLIPSQGAAPPKPELGIPTTNVYRTGASPALAMPQPSLPPPQLIRLPDQSHQYMAFHSMHHHPSQSTTAAGYGYDPLQPQPPIYYSQTSSVPMPPYQTMNSPAVHQSDMKQARAS